MFSLILLTALAQPAEPTKSYQDAPGPWNIITPAAPGGRPLEQMRARIDAKGNLTITYMTSTGSGPASQEITVNVPDKPGAEKVPVKATVKVTSLMVMTTELPAKYVDAYTVDGKSIPAEKLATLLEKERSVLVALDGKKVDPFLLELYKEGTIVLVLPANTMNMGYGAPSGEMVVPVPPRRLPVEPKPDRKPDGDK